MDEQEESMLCKAYNDTLDFDDQITTEEMIASMIFAESPSVRGLDEEACAELGRTILKAVLCVFRPDVFVEVIKE